MQANGDGTYVLNNNWPAYSDYALDTDTTSDITNADVYQSGTISSWNSFRMVKNSDGTYRIMSTYGGLYRALNAEMNDINAGKTPINCIFYQ